MKSRFSISNFLWDAWCVCSLVGIWPRFIEPNLLRTTPFRLSIPRLPQSLNGLKILQFSDLHFHSGIPSFFIDKLKKRISELKPDLILFTGDFLCYSKLNEKEKLTSFLQSFHAPYGCYAVLGNHDYANFVSLNDEGEYDVINPSNSSIARGLKRLFQNLPLKKRSTQKALETPVKEELISLLKDTPFQILNNTTIQLPVGKSKINLCGLGEYTLGKCLPEIAFKNYDPALPGIVLVHNPDAVPMLQKYPGDLILSGHTHGGQVYLPWIWKKFALMENQELLRGLKKIGRKWVYVNVGVGSVLPFRWRAVPEVLLVTLEGDNDGA